jgi:O-antigen/teichoic acid export membrane protein
MREKNNRIGGVSSDALMLTATKVVTAAIAMVVTRLISEYLTLRDYGTYSQVLLLVSAISSVTIFGMHDGVNFFYVGELDERKRDEYVATIFVLQILLSLVVGVAVLCSGQWICNFFDNREIVPLLIFAVVLPFLQNIMNMLRTVFVAVGKARLLAYRNLLVAIVRLIATVGIVKIVPHPAVILLVSVLLDVGQIVFFGIVLQKNQCRIQLRQAQRKRVKRVLAYCAPMAIYVIVNTLNRDVDKYFISVASDIETLAVYANASKQLPFDIIIASFCTVLVPSITENITKCNHRQATELYKLFLEIAYISTGILCGAALAAAPQLMKLLYSNKYMEGLPIFIVYILVDLLRFTNITLVLSAAGKTKKLMIVGLGAIAINILLNALLYHCLGVIGPAVATLIVTCALGIVMLYFSAKVLETGFSGLFDTKYMIIFAVEIVGLIIVLGLCGKYLSNCGVHYFVTLMIIAGTYGIIMLLFNGKRLLRDMKTVNILAGKQC